MTNSVGWWEKEMPADAAVTLLEIEPFNARGMRRVYGREDHFGREVPVFHLDIWKTKEGRLLARFWSRGAEVYHHTHEVLGYGKVDFPKGDDRWVPDVLRREYDEWLTCLW